MTEDLIGSVQNWLAETGYPLEMRVASQLADGLRDYPLAHNPNYMYEDPQTGQSREADYVYDSHNGNSYVSLVMTVVVECKATTNPWVIFSRDQNNILEPGPIVDFDSGIVTYQHQEVGQLSELTRTISAKMERANPGSRRPGYAIAEAFKKTGKDAAYDAVRQVVSASCGALANTFGPGDTRLGVAAAAPIVVTTSPVMEARLTSDRSSIKVEHFGAGRLMVSGQTPLPTPVLVIEESLVNHLIVERVKSFEAHATDAIEELSQQLKDATASQAEFVTWETWRK